MTAARQRKVQAAISVWAVASFVVALWPPGVGGLARAVNAVLFMTFGPACALVIVLTRQVDRAIALAVSVAASLTILVLASQLLLVMGLWAAWRVAGIVAFATVALALLPAWRAREVDADAQQTA